MEKSEQIEKLNALLQNKTLCPNIRVSVEKRLEELKDNTTINK